MCFSVLFLCLELQTVCDQSAGIYDDLVDGGTVVKKKSFSRRCDADDGAWKQIEALEATVGKLKKERKMRTEMHIAEIRARDRREAMLIWIFSVGCLVYALSALFIRGFV